MTIPAQLNAKQIAAVSAYLGEAKREHGLDEVVRIDNLAFEFRDEVRPGRGHDIVFAYVDGDHAFTGGLDPYGYGYMVVAEITIIHNSSDEECATNNDCAACRRADIEADGGRP